jgi:hypothetical protein
MESAERELASTEIVLRLERDLRELIARSAYAENRQSPLDGGDPHRIAN